ARRDEIDVGPCCVHQLLVHVGREGDDPRGGQCTFSRQPLRQVGVCRQVDDHEGARVVAKRVLKPFDGAEAAHVDPLEQLEAAGGHQVATGEEHAEHGATVHDRAPHA
ncbi:MAG: hypothetical protein JWO69_1850, partial [Thermoleophilia bacterium]|nr:hypothetical protein [Thermoleophilia bacterium]